ncbi:MAG TPA: glycosyltransferase family 4 protein [Gammaproteobacteria bacterium]|nr:glycosyltransferase family 4 protein [Gammaproteobacteria bacterium]
MYILFITDNFYPEGNAIASRVYERACYWIKWGSQVTVITSAPNFPEGKLYPGYKNKWYQVETIHGIKVIRVKTLIKSNTGFFLRILDFLSFMIPAFFAGLFQKRPDIVVATSPQFFGAIAACVLAKCKRIPFVLELGDIWPASIVGVGAMRNSLIIWMLEKVELLLYRYSNTIIVVSAAFKENLVSRAVPAKKILVILNGVDLSKYSPQSRNQALAKEYGIKETTFVVGYIGTHGMAHSLENVLTTAAKLQKVKSIRFIFVGTGAERDKLISEAKINQLTNVQFIPAQPKEIISSFWSLCNVALVHFKNTSTFAASIPSKIFEAMGMGLPILLASPRGAASEIVMGEKVGLWVQAENPEALTNAILQLYQCPDMLRQFAETSSKAARYHTREAQAGFFLDALKVTIEVIF